jgi:Probable cobalt transporter subunit (CbtB)
MTAAPRTRPEPRVAPVPVPLWGWLLLALAVTVLYLVVHDNGAVLAQAGDMTHEFFHDARHALGVPCH